MRQTKRILVVGIIVLIVLATAPITIGHCLEPVEKPIIKTARTEKFIRSDVLSLSWIYIKGMPDAIRESGTFGHILLAATLGIYLNVTIELEFENYYESQYTTIIIDGKHQSLEKPSKVRIENFYGFGTRIHLFRIIIGKIKFVGRGNITIIPLSS